MIHFKYLPEEIKKDVFYQLPGAFSPADPVSMLQYALGAALYVPGVNEGIATAIVNRRYPQLTSVILCLEDAIGDNEVKAAEKTLIQSMVKIKEALEEKKLSEADLPLIFVRVRSAEQLQKLLNKVDKLDLLCGFVLPKFTSQNGMDYLHSIYAANKHYGTNFYAMPILESPEVIYKESRIEELMKIKAIMDAYKNLILNVRIGATDFSSLFSIRRSIDCTIYDISVIGECITDIINIFSRSETNYVISGPVWEYFARTRVLKPTLRESPFIEEKGDRGRVERQHLLDESIDGLIREVLLDKANGLTGKTVIHPSHITYVNSLQAVTREEYEDALMIARSDSSDKGALKSPAGNKMNEIKPHTNWARKILTKARVYGVLDENASFTSLF